MSCDLEEEEEPGTGDAWLARKCFWWFAMCSARASCWSVPIPCCRERGRTQRMEETEHTET